jgi:hypothetical protein
MNHDAIYALYPNVVTVDDGTGAFDKDGNKVEIDIDAVNTKAQELQAAAESAKQAKADAKQSAIDKLTALGLTADEIAHLIP